MVESLRHKDVGQYRFSLFVVPEGDHYRWQVNRTDLGPQTFEHFGEKMATGDALTEAEAWNLAEAWLNSHLRSLPNG